MSAIVLYRIDQAKRMHRFYRLDLQPDLFGQWCLMREWGRIGSTGQTRTVPFPSPQEAQASLDSQRRAKERRGYSLNCQNQPAHGIPDNRDVSGL